MWSELLWNAVRIVVYAGAGGVAAGFFLVGLLAVLRLWIVLRGGDDES